MEPRISAYGPLAYAVDILVNNKQGTPLICCEVKSNSREHKKLISAFNNGCAKGPHVKSDCPNKSNHQKYTICEAVKARYFLAVSPQQMDCYSLTHLDGQIVPTRLGSVPSCKEVELD